MSRRPWYIRAFVLVMAVLAAATACTSQGLPERAPLTVGSTPATSSPPVSTASNATSPVAVTTTTAAGSGVASPSAPDIPTLPDVSAPDELPKTRTQQLQAAIDATGTITLQRAIDMFDLSMASMPGASPSTLPTGSGFSGTVALAAIQPYLSQLTPAQLAVVESFDGTTIAATTSAGSLTVVATDAVPTIGPQTTGTPTATGTPTTTPTTTATPVPTTTHAAWSVPTSAPAVRPAAFAPPVVETTPTAPLANSHLIDLFNQTLKDWDGYRADLIALPQGFSLRESAVQPKDGTEMDSRRNLDLRGACIITLYPQVLNGNYPDATIKYVYAHEMFHCIQFRWSSGSGPDWLIEGSAEFAALDLYRHTFQPVPTEAYEDWFTDPGRPLGQEPAGRGYGTWPLFEAFKEQYATDPYPYIEDMIKAGGSDANRLQSVRMDNPVFDSLWTSTSLRSTQFDDASFQLPWPGADPGYGTHNTAVDMGSRGLGKYNVKGKGNYVHQQYLLDITSAVGVVGVTPTGGQMMTHADAGTVSMADKQQKWFCTDSAHCPCPPGTHPKVHLDNLTSPMLFSFATQQRASQAAVTALAWDPAKYCTADTDPGDEPASPSGSSNGDPHVTTFNGLPYDFMTYGEFVTAQDTTGGFTVEERHQWAGFGTAITAVALGDGTHRVTLTVPTTGSKAANVVVRLDGTATSSSAGSSGTLRLVHTDTDRWTVSWPDGSAVEMYWDSGFFVTVMPSSARSPHIVGLLGTPGSNFLEDLAMPDGTRAVPDDSYSAFAKAWLITDATSLFDYAAGQNTETFRTSGQPVPPVRQPDATVVTACQQGLGSAATTAEINACSYDVTSTGDTSLVSAYHDVVQERAAQVVSTPASGSPPRIVVGGTTTPAESSGPAPSGPGGGTSVTLHGLLYPDTALNGTTELTGTMTLTAGTVVVVRTTCPSNPDIDLQFAAFMGNGGPATSTGLCGSLWKNEVYNSNSNGETHEGESYLLINQTGTYNLAAHNQSSSPTSAPAQVSISVYSDPNPTIVPANALPAAGTTVTLSGIGSSLVVEAQSTSGATWTITGGAQVCGQVYYINGPTDLDTSADDLGGVCWHHTSLGLGGSSRPLPIVIFNRTATPVTVTVKRTQ